MVKKTYGITLALVIKFMLIEKNIISNTLQKKNSPENSEVKNKVDSFMHLLTNKQILIDITKENFDVLIENKGNKKTISISFNEVNYHELTKYMKENKITLGKIISDYLHLDGTWKRIEEE